MKDKIIIDGIDVSNCGYFILKYDEDEDIEITNYCELCHEQCKNYNCYYKQLQRMDKCYGELMEENARILAKLEKAEFENRKLKRENQELRDNYVNLDLQRVKEYNHLLDLFQKTSGELFKMQEELDPNIHLAKVDIKLEGK